MRATNRRLLSVLTLVAAGAAALLVSRSLASRGGTGPAPRGRPPLLRDEGRPGRQPTGPSAATTTTASTTTTTTVPATQTTVRPSAETPRFHAEMAALFRGIRLDAPAVAAEAFFPEAAYVRLKAITDPASDFEGRLMAEFRLDVAAAHALLGAHARAARLVGVTVPEREAAWIPPGYCANGIGYWHDPGARLLYRSDGVLRSIGIASLISWHGVWYVVHLGGVVRPSTVGLVDTPAVGPGVPGAPGGC